MADRVNLEMRVRKRLNSFLRGKTRAWRGLTHVTQTIESHNWPAFVFGGVIRDLASVGTSRGLRDVDIVVSEASAADLAKVFGAYVVRSTRFGGLRLNVEGWPVDIWPLQDTWALRKFYHHASFEYLPRTTFLNAEAIAAELSTKKGRRRKVFSEGFFEAFENKQLEMNLESNPYPALCLVRSLITASRLEFSLGTKLAAYISSHGHQIPMAELLKVQVAHYGRVICAEKELHDWIEAINNQLASGKEASIHLPISRPRQLELWKDSAAGR